MLIVPSNSVNTSTVGFSASEADYVSQLVTVHVLWGRGRLPEEIKARTDSRKQRGRSRYAAMLREERATEIREKSRMVARLLAEDSCKMNVSVPKTRRNGHLRRV
jgi:hypothetical protein